MNRPTVVAFRFASAPLARNREHCIFATEDALAQSSFSPLTLAEMAETVVRAGAGGGGGAVRPQLLHRREQEEAQGRHLPR